jgi:hypothetical protein
MSKPEDKPPEKLGDKPAIPPAKPVVEKAPLPPEFGGPTGPEPTRYGDWERNGRVSDF